MARPSRASASLSVSGGAIRSVLPYRPPLPMSSPRSRVSSSMRAASFGLACAGGGVDHVEGEHQALAATTPPTGLAAAASRRPGMMIWPSAAALACRSWEST